MSVPGPAARRPVAHAVRAVLLEQRHRRDDVALRLRHLLAIGIEHPARRSPRCVHGSESCSRCARSTVVEQPGADDVVRLRAQVHRKRAREQIAGRPASRRRSAASATRSPTCPSRRDRRRSRRAAPRCSGAIAGGHVGRRIDRQLRPRRAAIGRSYSTRPSASSGYQTGNGTPKNRCRLTHQSPFRPLAQFSKRACMYGRMPLQLAAAREQRLAELDRLDEPLAAGDDFERAIALLVELHRVRDRPRLADQIAAIACSCSTIFARAFAADSRASSS